MSDDEESGVPLTSSQMDSSRRDVSSNKRKESLSRSRVAWTTLDKVLVIFNICIKFGDSIEIYLPGKKIVPFLPELF